MINEQGTSIGSEQYQVHTTELDLHKQYAGQTADEKDEEEFLLDRDGYLDAQFYGFEDGEYDHYWLQEQRGELGRIGALTASMIIGLAGLNTLLNGDPATGAAVLASAIGLEEYSRFRLGLLKRRLVRHGYDGPPVGRKRALKTWKPK